MNSLILLTVICIIYYCIYKWYPHYLEERYHYYLVAFVTIYLLIIYMFSYENEFMYKMFKNIYDTSRQPLYSFNASEFIDATKTSNSFALSTESANGLFVDVSNAVPELNKPSKFGDTPFPPTIWSSSAVSTFDGILELRYELNWS